MYSRDTEYVQYLRDTLNGRRSKSVHGGPEALTAVLSDPIIRGERSVGQVANFREANEISTAQVCEEAPDPIFRPMSFFCT